MALRFIIQKVKAVFRVGRSEGWMRVVTVIWFILKNDWNNYFIYPRKKAKYRELLQQVLSNNPRVFLWTQAFGWNVALFQRPQHIARCLSQKGNIVFYYVNSETDPEVDSITEIENNLYLINRNNITLKNELLSILTNINGRKYLHFYSTDLFMSLEDMKKYQKMGFDLLYEYIDDISPAISTTLDVPVNILEKHDYIMNTDRIPLVVTASVLWDEAVEKRKSQKNIAFASNGVDVDHFTCFDKEVVFKKRFIEISHQYSKIVGYYGAFATWFDYELLIYAAKAFPKIAFVLIGKEYDDTLRNSGLDNQPNVFYIGAVPYKDLPQYAKKFAVCTIPFLINDITNATSPLKLFEYMALGKPILTTDMLECKKYESVVTAATHQDYVNKLAQLLEYSPETQPEYFEIMKKECRENTWMSKTEIILQVLQHYEEQNSCMRKENA